MPVSTRLHCSFLERRKNRNSNGKLPPCESFTEKKEKREGRGSGLGGGVGGGRRKTSGKKKEKKKNPQQAIRLIFSQPGLWVHCLVFAGAQAVCPGGATF